MQDYSFPRTVRCLSGSYFPPFDTVHWLKGTFSRISMPLRQPLSIIILFYLYVKAVGGTWIPAPAQKRSWLRLNRQPECL